MSQKYILTDAYFAFLRKRFYYVVAPICLLALITGFLIATLQRGISIGAIVVVPILLVVIIFSLRKSLVQVQKSWASYQLIIEPDSITRQQDHYETIKIFSHEITRIQAVTRGSIIVHGDQAKKQIIIPDTLENFDEVKAILVQWHKIDDIENKLKQNTIIIYTAAVVTLVVMGIVMLGEKSPFILALAIVFLLLLVSSFFFIQRSNAVDTKTKRVLWWIILPIIMVGTRTYFLLVMK